MRIIPGGRLSFSANMRFKKSVVSWIYDGMFCNSGFRMKSAYCESFTIQHPQPDMIGISGMPGLCILRSRYSIGVLAVFSADKKVWS